MREDKSLEENASSSFEYECKTVNKDVLALIIAFNSISSPLIKSKVLSLVKMMASSDGEVRDGDGGDLNTMLESEIDKVDDSGF